MDSKKMGLPYIEISTPCGSNGSRTGDNMTFSATADICKTGNLCTGTRYITPDISRTGSFFDSSRLVNLRNLGRHCYKLSISRLFAILLIVDFFNSAKEILNYPIPAWAAPVRISRRATR